VAAAKHGVPWAHLCAGVLDLTPPADYLEVREWVHSGLARVRETAGLPADDSLDLLFSPYLMIVTSSPALTGPAPLPEQCVLIGAALSARMTRLRLGPVGSGRQHVLVSQAPCPRTSSGTTWPGWWRWNRWDHGCRRC
jgi:hypothetical protein